MTEIEITLNNENFPFVIRQYGLEGAKQQGIAMCIVQKLEINKENIHSMLSNLESDLTEIFSYSGAEPEEERFCKKCGENVWTSVWDGREQRYMDDSNHDDDVDQEAITCSYCNDIYCKKCDEIHECYSCGEKYCNDCTEWHKDDKGDYLCENCYAEEKEEKEFMLKGMKTLINSLGDIEAGHFITAITKYPEYYRKLFNNLSDDLRRLVL